VLDRSLAVGGLLDVATPAAQFASLAMPARRIFITENEVNGLAFPDVAEGIVVFGLGYGRQGKDLEALVRFHVRRLEALRRVGHVERVDADHWRFPRTSSTAAWPTTSAGAATVRGSATLSILDLEQQIGCDGGT
jgi:hypothetical protein